MKTLLVSLSLLVVTGCSTTKPLKKEEFQKKSRSVGSVTITGFSLRG